MKNQYSLGTGLSILLWLFAINPAFGQAWTDTLEIPPIVDSGNDSLFVDIETHDFGRPGLDSVKTLAYNYSGSGTNSYLGPTLVWEKNRPQKTTITNRLGGNNITTVHWHGANVPANTDGGPHQIITTSTPFSPEFVVLDDPATLWYHPHGEDITYTQVQAGLAGIIIVRDPLNPVEAIVPSQYGIDDIPLIIQDIAFRADTIDTLQGTPATPKRQTLVNGTIQPKLNVPPQPVQFRVLDGSTRNAFMLAFVRDTNNVVPSERLSFSLLASDGGYLPDSVRTIDSLETSVGIRNGIIMDFTPFPGDTFYLVNIPTSLRQGTVGSSQNRPPIGNALVQIIVGQTQEGTPGIVPTSLPAIAPLGTPSLTRTINLNGRGAPASNLDRFSINNNQYEFDVINTVVYQGAIEDWQIANNTPIAHPFHIHLIQFFVQSVEDIATGAQLPIPVEYLGPKDDILVQPGQRVTFRAIFDSYSVPMPFDPDTDTYMYHCHILTHEDGYYTPGNPNVISGRRHWGMMQQFVVWNGIVNNDLSQPLGESMVLFPNPASGEINLNGESGKMSTLRVYDLQGKRLLERLLPPFSGTVPVDVSQLGTGMVLVEWESADGRFVKKVVLE